jgi:hypothetical protein
MLNLLLTFLLHVYNTKHNDNAYKVRQTNLNKTFINKTTSWAETVRWKQNIIADLPFYFEPCVGESCYPWHFEALDLFPELSGTVAQPCRISSSGDTGLLNHIFSVYNFYTRANQLNHLRYLNIMTIKCKKIHSDNIP